MPPELQQPLPTPQSPPLGGTPSPQPAAPSPAPGTQGQNQPTAKGSLFEDAGLPEPGTKGSTTWPEDWRLQLAGGDAKRAKELERYASPDKVAESWFGLRQRVGSGEFRANTPKPTGEGVTPEQVAAWKQERGLPVEAKEYPFPLMKGVTMEDLGEDGAKVLDQFRGAFFEADMTPQQAERIVGEYNKIQEAEAEAQAVNDGKLKDGCEDALRADWGAEFRTNMASTFKFLGKTFGEEGLDALMTARDIEGRRIINMPGVVKALHQLARSNGIDDFEGGEPMQGGKTVDQRLAEINQILSTNKAEYLAKGLDKEKMALLERKERAGGR